MSKIKECELLKALNVSHACAKDDTRPILQGVNFKGNNICALDGYRLSLREIEDLNIENEITINPKGIKALKSILDKKSEHEVNIKELEKDVAFESEDIELKLHKYVSDYVRYESLIPSDFAYEYEIDKKELLDTLKILKKEFKGIKKDQHPVIKIIQKDFDISIQANTCIKLNNARIVQKFDDEFCIACNINFLMESLKSLDDEEETIRIKMISPIKPIMLTNDNKNLEMILPIRLAR